MEYQVLGPLQVVGGSGERRTALPRTPRAVKIKILLGTLVMRANEVVSLDQLLDSMWGGNGPRSARSALHVYVSQLRKFLGEDAGSVQTCAGGYLLATDPADIDCVRLERLVRTGRSQMEADDHGGAAETLSEALDLWRGPALPDLLDSPVLRNAAVRLDELRMGALEMRVEADLALGRDRHIIGELLGLVGEHPFRETFHRQLMIALYRSERQSDALRVYSQLRRTLHSELGLEPCRALRALQQAILRSEHTLDRYVAPQALVS